MTHLPHPNPFVLQKMINSLKEETSLLVSTLTDNLYLKITHFITSLKEDEKAKSLALSIFNKNYIRRWVEKSLRMFFSLLND